MAEIIEFKKPEKADIERELTDSEQKLWNAVVRETYNKLLPNGLSQNLADRFLAEFKPLFMIILPKDIKLYFEEGMDEQIQQTRESLDKYFLDCIGSVLYNQLTLFLKRELDAQST